MTAFEQLLVLAGVDSRGRDKLDMRCPGHDDRRASLSVAVGRNGNVVLHCQAGCETEDVLAAWPGGALTMQALFDDWWERRLGPTSSEIGATYDYVDESGALLFQVVRKTGKRFVQRRPDGAGDWIWKLGSTRRVLYRLPRVLEAVRDGVPVYVAEGEKDVHALERVGCVATCNPGGAGKWRDEYAEALRSADVTVVQDRDDAGRKHARAVVAALRGVAASVRLVEAAQGKDAADHLRAGLSVSELVDVELDSTVSAEPTTASSGALFVRASEVASEALRWAWIARLLLRYLAVLTGLEGLGKSVFACWVIARLTRGELDGEFAGQPVAVLVVASEDGIRDVWKPRLTVAGAELELVQFLALDKLGDDWNIRDGIDAIRDVLREGGARVFFVDALLDHMPGAKAGESINSPTFVRAALAPLRRAVRELDVAGAFSMHPPKGRAASFRELVQASQAFGAIPRIGLLLAYHPDDAQLPEQQRRRVLLRGKGNVGADPGGLQFHVAPVPLRHDDGRVVDVPRVERVESCALTLADMFADAVVGARAPTKREQAERMIAALLDDDAWHESLPILKALEQADVSFRTAQRAASTLHVRKRKRPGIDDGPWEWRRAPVEDANEHATEAGAVVLSSSDEPSRAHARAPSTVDVFSQNPPKQPIAKGRRQDDRESLSDVFDRGRRQDDELSRVRARRAPWGDGTLGEAYLIQRMKSELGAVELDDPTGGANE
jgi:5S rRNA maturation endonuclease (ribonuclease M5)